MEGVQRGRREGAGVCEFIVVLYYKQFYGAVARIQRHDVHINRFNLLHINFYYWHLIISGDFD